LADCLICSKKFGWGEQKYDFGKNRVFCFECMTCSICGSKADGGFRGIIGTQPFCKECFEEAKVEMAKPLNDWSDKYLESKLNHLTKWRGFLLERMGKALGVSKAEWFITLTDPLSVSTLNLTASKNLIYQQYNDAVKSLDTQIEEIRQELARRKEPKTSLPPATDHDPITILKVRYAKGEITKDEYEEMLKTLSTT